MSGEPPSRAAYAITIPPTANMLGVIYQPPQTRSFGHGSKFRDARKSWQAAQAFLREHTVSVLQSPLKLSVAWPSQWCDEAVGELAQTDARKLFGPSTILQPSHWELPLEHFDEALEFAFADGVRPKQAIGPVKLSFWYDVDWLDMPKLVANPSERLGSRGSQLGVSIGGRKLFFQPHFQFGASYQDYDFVSKLKALELSMPFVPRDDYYFRLETKKDASGEKLVKLQSGWRDAE